MNKDTQSSLTLEYMQNNGGITSMEAFQMFGVTRLSSIIFNLRNAGYHIETVRITSKNRYGNSCNYARYILKED
jgi:hypothetical protein